MKSIEWHVRGNVASTVKEGWRVADITVSADYEEGVEPTKAQYQERVNDLFALLDEFCQQRNRESGKLSINGTSITHSASGVAQ